MAEKEKEPEIEIVTDDEDSLKIVGELLSNKTSRDLIKFLMSKSAYKKKISDELGVPFSLVEYHLKKLEKLGLVTITNKKLIKGGVLHKSYKINADGIFIMFNTKEEIKEKGILKKIFREGVKFASIGIAGYFVYLTDIFNFSNSDKVYGIPFGQQTLLIDPIIPGLIVIINGLIIERLISFKKKKKGV